MPCIDGFGRVAAGIGSSGVSVDNKPIAAGGCACWLRDGVLIYNGPDAAGDWRLWSYDLATGEATMLDARGANFISAGGGRWAAQAAALYGNFDFDPGAMTAPANIDNRGAANHLGAVALAVDANRQAFDVYEPGEAPWRVQAVAYNLCLPGPGQAIWDGGERGVTVWTPTAMTRRRLVEHLGVDYVVGYAASLGAIVCIENGASSGRILTTGPAYCHDARSVGGKLLVAWSTTQGEAAGSNVLVDALSFPLGPLVPAIPGFRFIHPVIVAPFKDPEGVTTAPWEIVVNQAGQRARRPCVVAEDSLAGPLAGPLEGIYGEAADPSALVALAGAHGTRAVLGHDSTAPWSPPASLRAWDVPALELYLSAGETVAQSADRWISQAEAVLADWAGDVAVIPMFYCAGGAPPDEQFPVSAVLEGLTHLEDVVNLSSRVKLIMPFEYLRANGITAHPELERAFENLLAEQRRVGLAALTPVGAPPEPPKPDPPKPDPPKPPSPVTTLEGVHMTEPQKVALVGPNGRYMRVDANRQIFFDRDAVGADETFTAEWPDGDGRGRATLTPQNHTDVCVGADLTQYGSNAVDKIFYLKPKAQGVGNYELWDVRRDAKSVLVVAMMQYIDQGVLTKPFSPVNLTVVPL